MEFLLHVYIIINYLYFLTIVQFSFILPRRFKKLGRIKIHSPTRINNRLFRSSELEFPQVSSTRSTRSWTTDIMKATIEDLRNESHLSIARKRCTHGRPPVIISDRAREAFLWPGGMQHTFTFINSCLNRSPARFSYTNEFQAIHGGSRPKIISITCST